MRRLDVDILFFFQYIMGKRWNVHKMAIMTCSKWISTIFQAFCHTFCGAHANFGQTGNNRALITLKNEQWPQLVPLN